MEEEDDVAESKAFEFVSNERSLLCDRYMSREIDNYVSGEIDEYASRAMDNYVSRKIAAEEVVEEEKTQRHDVMVEKDADDSTFQNSLELRNHGDSKQMWEQLAFPFEHVDVVREPSPYEADHLDDVEEQASH